MSIFTKFCEHFLDKKNLTKGLNILYYYIDRKEGIHIKLRDYKEWYKIVRPIITSKEYLKRKTFRHHGDTSVYEHCIKVSQGSFKLAKKLGLDYKSAAIAGVLHDLYTTPWQDVLVDQPFFQRHAFSHARCALENSRKYYSKYLNPKIENAVLRHMFPLNIVPPKYSTGYIITLVDKLVSMDFVFCKETWAKTFRFLRRG